MKKLYSILIIAILVCVTTVLVILKIQTPSKLGTGLKGESTVKYDDWSCAEMGAGGWFNGLEAGPDGTMLLTSDLSGSYISYDRGESWKCVGAKSGVTSTHSCGIGFDPVDSNVIFIGSSGGMFRSEDKGKSFTKVLESGFCTDIAISKSDHNIGYATATSSHAKADGKIYKTTDNGKTWTALQGNLPTEDVMIQEIFINPQNANELYAHSYKGRFTESSTLVETLFKSTDGGITWTSVHTGVFDFAVKSSDFNTVYITGKEIGTLKSTDGGKTWAVCDASAWGALHLSGDKTVRVIGSSKHFESTDSGKTWTETPIRSSDFAPGIFWNGAGDSRKCDDMSNSDVVFYKNVAWAWMSTDGGKTVKPLWNDEVESGWYKGRGMLNTNANTVSISGADSNVVYICFADMGLWRSMDGGDSWQSCNNTDIGSWASTDGTKKGVGGMSQAVKADYTRSNVVWANLRYGLYKSENYGRYNSWVKCEGLPTTDETRVTGIAVAPSSDENNRTVYTIANGIVYKSEDDGATFKALGNRFTALCLEVSATNKDVVYVGSNAGVYKCEGKSFTLISNEEITNVSQIISNGNDVYVASFGINKGLYKTSNDGVKWEKILEDTLLRGIAIHPENPKIIFTTSSYATGSGGYLATCKGVQLTLDGGKTWQEVNNGLEWNNIWKVCIDPKEPSKVFIATRGLGIQRTTFDYGE